MAILRTKNPETGKWEEVPVVAGKNGKSAYEYAKEGGFTGTEAEFGAQLGASASVLTDAKQYTDDKVRDASNESAAAIGALQEAVNGKAAASDLASHVGNASNPHGVTAAQIGADESGAAAAALAEAKNYTDSEIAELINGAPTTLDTLGEIATAMTENADVVKALNDAIGSKAAATDLTAHTDNKNNPHGVTAAQVGADASGSANAALTSAKAYTDAHSSNKSNPHSVTAAQVGALPLGGGTMTGSLEFNGGDQIGSSKMVLATGKGQITNSGTQTLFGFLNDADLATGHSSYNLKMRGKATRPSYNGGDLALKSDIPTVPTKTSQLTNDSGFLTQHQDLSAYAKKDDLPSKTENWTFTLADGSTVTKEVYLK